MSFFDNGIAFVDNARLTANRCVNFYCQVNYLQFAYPYGCVMLYTLWAGHVPPPLAHVDDVMKEALAA
jgi:hypothetical protein